MLIGSGSSVYILAVKLTFSRTRSTEPVAYMGFDVLIPGV